MFTPPPLWYILICSHTTARPSGTRLLELYRISSHLIERFKHIFWEYRRKIAKQKYYGSSSSSDFLPFNIILDIVSYPRWRFSIELRTRQVTFPTRGLRRSRPPRHSDRLHPLANGALRSQVKSGEGKKTPPLTRRTCRAYAILSLLTIVIALVLGKNIIHFYARLVHIGWHYGVKYNNTMRFVHLLPCTVICAMHTHHTYTHTHTL